MHRSHSRSTFKFDKFVPKSLRDSKNGKLNSEQMQTMKKLQIRKNRQFSQKEARLLLNDLDKDV